jgi:hypothetical protein
VLWLFEVSSGQVRCGRRGQLSSGMVRSGAAGVVNYVGVWFVKVRQAGSVLFCCVLVC